MPLPDLRLRAVVPAVLGACLLALSFASAAAAVKSKTVPGELRVVDSNGKTLAEQTQYTGSVKIETDPKASCFGPGTGGSGDVAQVPGATALGLLADAGTTDRDVTPLSVTDSFDFGLGLCGIGKAVAPETGFWYLKQNHVASQTGGDQTELSKGDEILWYLIEDFNAPVPDELVLSASTRVKDGADIPVKVVSYADDGTRSPAEGVDVAGADGPTDAAGKTTVAADGDLVELSATRAGSIPSNKMTVCTLAAAKCPAGYAQTIGGGDGDDKITVDQLASTVLAGDGDDRIKATQGSSGEIVKCGTGDDELVIAKAISKRSKASGCERIKIVR